MDQGSQPATKADLQDLRAELQDQAAQLRAEQQQFRAEVHHSYDDLKETMRDGQTELLKAIYNYVETTDLKLRDGQATDASLRDRMSVLERRLTDVEKRLNMPPAA
jgi:hypothetical protein